MRVLFCVDGSDLALQAAVTAGRLLKPLRPEGTVVHVLPEVDQHVRHYERLHEEELRDIECQFGAENAPSVAAVRAAQKAFRQEGLKVGRKVRVGGRWNRSCKRRGKGCTIWSWSGRAGGRGLVASSWGA